MESIKSYFYFTKGERLGILVLLFFIVLSMAAPRLTRILFAVEPQGVEDLSPEIQSFINQLSDTMNTYESEQPDSGRYAAKIRPYAPFSSGQEGGSYAKTAGSLHSSAISCDLNTADSLTLLRLPGIGPAFAHRILRYRARLGGFIKVEQLMEVYGFTAEKLEGIRKNIRVNPGNIRGVNVNTASFKEIMKHPYSSYEVAKAICNFRTGYGRIERTEDIQKAGIIADSTYFKLFPYLRVE